MNSRHPETPARGWGGSEPQLLTPLRGIPGESSGLAGSGGEFLTPNSARSLFKKSALGGLVPPGPWGPLGPGGTSTPLRRRHRNQPKSLKIAPNGSPSLRFDSWTGIQRRISSRSHWNASRTPKPSKINEKINKKNNETQKNIFLQFLLCAAGQRSSAVYIGLIT